MNLVFLAGAFVVLFHTGNAIPKELHRYGRSWEAEACSSRNLRNQDRYICTHDGKIRCLDGWIGDLCQVPRCGNECDPQHGYCVKPGECKCNLGYFGPSCTDCVKLPGCQNGYCKKSFECRCEDGWSGMFCNTPECHQDCERNNGFCAGPGKCECKRGYSGQNCSECSTLPGCKNGSCNKPLECICEEGWTGIFCNQPVCAANCSKDFGTCYRPGECRCRLGYQGEDCGECVAYPGCVNGDCLQPYDCNCKDGWAGHMCDQPEVETFGPGVRGGKCQPLGSFVCMNGGQDTCSYYGNGTMVGQPLCGCKPGFSGTWCESEESVQSKEIQPKKSGGTNEVIEPRNSGTGISGNGLLDEADSTTGKDVTPKTATNDVENPSTDKNEMIADKPVAVANEKEDNDKQVTVKDEAGDDKIAIKEEEDSEKVTSKPDFDEDKETSVNDDEKVTTTSTSEPIVTSEDVDWSKRSNTNSPENSPKPETTTAGGSSSEQTPTSNKADKAVEDVSELGVRAIHSDVFNSGKLIENFGSEEGLQSFKDY